jgi:hypothetical protein
MSRSVQKSLCSLRQLFQHENKRARWHFLPKRENDIRCKNQNENGRPRTCSCSHYIRYKGWMRVFGRSSTMIIQDKKSTKSVYISRALRYVSDSDVHAVIRVLRQKYMESGISCCVLSTCHTFYFLDFARSTTTKPIELHFLFFLSYRDSSLEYYIDCTSSSCHQLQQAHHLPHHSHHRIILIIQVAPWPNRYDGPLMRLSNIKLPKDPWTRWTSIGAFENKRRYCTNDKYYMMPFKVIPFDNLMT